MYAVKEIFYTLQGEGANTGRAAIFCRLRAAICGRGAKPTAIARIANSAIQTSWAPMALAEGASKRRANWPKPVLQQPETPAPASSC